MVFDCITFSKDLNLSDIILLGGPSLGQEALAQEGPMPLPPEAEAAEWWWFLRKHSDMISGKNVCVCVPL